MTKREFVMKFHEIITNYEVDLKNAGSDIADSYIWAIDRLVKEYDDELEF